MKAILMLKETLPMMETPLVKTTLLMGETLIVCLVNFTVKATLYVENEEKIFVGNPESERNSLENGLLNRNHFR